MRYFVLIFAFVIGFFATWASQRLVRLYFKVGGWEKVKAKVLSKEVVLKKQSTSKGTPYKIVVRYSYRYNNKDYQGDKFHLSELVGGFNSYMKSDADKRLAEIQNEVEIYVNPNDPSQSVMERGGIFLYVVMLIMALFSFLIGFGYFFDKK